MQVFYMGKLNAGILSSPYLNSNNFLWSLSNEYSKFNKLCKSVVSNPEATCFAAIRYTKSP